MRRSMSDVSNCTSQLSIVPEVELVPAPMMSPSSSSSKMSQSGRSYNSPRSSGGRNPGMSIWITNIGSCWRVPPTFTRTGTRHCIELVRVNVGVRSTGGSSGSILGRFASCPRGGHRQLSVECWYQWQSPLRTKVGATLEKHPIRVYLRPSAVKKRPQKNPDLTAGVFVVQTNG